jgi:hypothetical protein
MSTRSSNGPAASFAREWVATGVSALIGAGAAAAGFTPFNNVANIVRVDEHPLRVVLLPEFVLTVVAVVAAAAYRRPRPERPPAPLIVGAAATLAGGLASLTASDAVGYSTTLLIVGVVSPIVLATAVWASRLSPAAAAAGFLTAAATLFFRADGVLIRTYGFPTAHDLFTAKFSNAAYDFHYYTLENPDHSSIFLIIPLTFSAFWALSPTISTAARRLLVASTLFFLANLIFVYVRVGMALGLVVVLAAFSASRRPRRERIAVTATVLAVVAVVARFTSAWTYLRAATSTQSGASGVERIRSLASGFRTMVHHPVTGVGLGRYGASPLQAPAHSALFQAGAEAGILAFAGIALLLGYYIVAGARLSVRRRWHLGSAAAVACGVYALDTLLAGGADLGFFNGYVAVWGIAFALCAGIALRREASVRREVAVPVRGRRALAVGAAVAAVALLVGGIASVKTSHATTTTTSVTLPEPPTARPVQLAAIGGTVHHDWTFAHGVPTTWELVGGATGRQANGATLVETAPGRYTYALQSPPILAGRGEWAVAISGAVIRGRLAVGALDVARNRWIATVQYRPTSSSEHRGPALVFAVPTRRYVQIILTNSTPAPERSLWLVRSVRVRRLGAPPRGAATIEVGQLTNPPVAVWGPIRAPRTFYSTALPGPAALVVAKIVVRRGTVRVSAAPIGDTGASLVVRPVDTLTGLTFVGFRVPVDHPSPLRIVVEPSLHASWRITSLTVRPPP